MRSDGTKFDEPGKSTTSKKRKLREEDNREETASGGSSSTGVIVLEEVLEEAPKWKVLREVLEEIEQERQKATLTGEECLVEDEESDNGIVLITCKDELSCMQLEDIITNNPRKV